MAPGYRANNQSRRANRGYVDHDVFEGLPVRNWRRDTITVAPPPVHEPTTQKDKWDVELPWGMPKDSHLLPQHSQDLLRAARSGRLYIRRPPAEEEELDPDAALGDKTDKKKEEDTKEKGFLVKTWKLVPKHLEGPEIEFLAKKRKGLTGSAIRPISATGTAITKARVRRTDAAGNTYVEDVVMQEGQTVEGELLSQTVISNPALSGAPVDGVPSQPTPPRRRPPPPKRKAKGPGRGRKRKLPLPPTSVPGQPSDVKTEAELQQTGGQDGVVGLDGIKLELSAPARNEISNEDIELGDDSGQPSDDDGEDGSDDEEGDDQGDGDDDEIDRNESALERIETNETNESADTGEDSGNSEGRRREVSSSPDLPLAAMVHHSSLHEHGTAGSPLKNVVTFAQPTYNEQSPDMHSDGEAEAEGDLDDPTHDNMHENPRHDEIQGSMELQGYHISQEEGINIHHEQIHPYGLNLSTGNHENDHDVMGLQMQQGGKHFSEEDDEMLLDGDVSVMDDIDFSTMSAGDHHFSDNPDQHFHDEHGHVEDIDMHMHNHDDHQHEEAPSQHFSIHVHGQEHELSLQAPGIQVEHHEMQTHGHEEDDNFEDLLGSLEDHLDAQEPGHVQGLEAETHTHVQAEPELKLLESQTLLEIENQDPSPLILAEVTDKLPEAARPLLSDSAVDKINLPAVAETVTEPKSVHQEESVAAGAEVEVEAHRQDTPLDADVTAEVQEEVSEEALEQLKDAEG